MARLENLTVTVADDDPSVVVAEGQIDTHTSTSLDEALSAMAAEASVSVNLSGVTFVDSSGLRTLVRAHNRHRNAGGDLIIVEPSAPVVRLLEITGLSSELRIEP